MIDVDKIRSEFPILQQKIYGSNIVYLDNGATTQKPKGVIDAVTNYYTKQNSNIHRGVHYLSQLATDSYEEARKCVQSHLNAKYSHEIIFTRGTTEAINLVASSLKSSIKKDDEIIISTLEHHSNIVPWQMICESTGAKLKVIPIKADGSIDIEAYKNLISSKTKIVAVTHVSNALGSISPIKSIITLAKKNNSLVLVDGAQAAPHLKVDVQDLDVDFYCISGHKVYAPTGVGVLYGKESLLNNLPPYQGGGEMISSVTFEKTTYAPLPHKFEAGTPNIAGGIGLKTAIEWINNIGLDNIAQHEESLLKYATNKLKNISGFKLYGESKEKTAVISFLIEGIHPYDVGVILDKMGVAVRTGHHCAQPIMDNYCIPGTIRASFGVYNNKEDVDRLVDGVFKAEKMLR